MAEALEATRIIVVMPLFDEEPHVARTLATLPACVAVVVLVDDGSRDGSVAAATAAGDARLALVRHERRLGVGRALATGFAEAVRLGAEIVVTMDADGQMDPADLPALLAPIRAGTADYAKGCRFDPAISLDAMPAHRRLANRVLSWLSARVLGESGLRDAHCGYTAASREVVQALDLAALHPSYGVYTSILAQVLKLRGARVAYVPVQALYGCERSHVRARDLVSLAGLLLRLWSARPAAVWRTRDAEHRA